MMISFFFFCLIDFKYFDVFKFTTDIVLYVDWLIVKWQPPGTNQSQHFHAKLCLLTTGCLYCLWAIVVSCPSSWDLPLIYWVKMTSDLGDQIVSLFFSLLILNPSRNTIELWHQRRYAPVNVCGIWFSVNWISLEFQFRNTAISFAYEEISMRTHISFTVISARLCKYLCMN